MCSLSAMLGLLLFAALLVVSGNPRPESAGTADFETRCGWFSNPTPANVWLYDRDADWTIGVQGGYQVANDWDWPAFKKGEWVKTNNDYGYGCACFELRVNKDTKEVLEIKSSRARPLSACRNDESLKKWKKLFK